MPNQNAQYTFKIGFGKVVTEKIQAHLAKTGESMSEYITTLVIRNLITSGEMTNDELIRSYASRQDRASRSKID